MGFSSIVVALTLFACVSQMRAAEALKIPSPEFDTKPQMQSEKFTVHISERGAKFDEKVEISEEKDAAYFKVPPHNGLSETDDMYDFKMNITVSRVKKDRVCYIRPLPADLPRPNVLSRGLKKFSNLPPNHNTDIAKQQWKVGGIVDKNTLRTEVRDFCGQFSFYRLEPYALDSVSVVTGDKDDAPSDRTRRKRQAFPICINGGTPPPCHPNKWKYSCKIQRETCVYYVRCNRVQRNIVCKHFPRHLFNSVVCCEPRC